MITLLASLAGFLSSCIPELFKFMNSKNDQKHELAILTLQMQAQAADRDARTQEIGVQADTEEVTALYRTYSTGVKWVDAYNGTVRPTLTYAFFILYASVKFMQYAAISRNAP